MQKFSIVRILKPTVFLALWSIFFGHCQAALTIRDYDPNRHDRFNNSPDFVGADYDWSGVGRSDALDTSRWGTLISPSFMLTTRHVGIGGSYHFYEGNDPSGPVETRTVLSNSILTLPGSAIGSDLRIVQLSSPVSNAVFYPILNSTPAAGTELFVFGQSNTSPTETSMRLGRNVLDEVLTDFSDPALTGTGDVFVFDYDTTNGVGGDECRLVGGDSGGPTFTIVGDTPVLLGIHWFNYTADEFNPNPGSGDTLVTSFVEGMNTFMASTGSSERVTLIAAVPEPGCLAIVSVALAFTVSKRSRLRRSA